MAWIAVRIHGPVREVLRSWPVPVRKELGTILTRLQKQESIGMPDIRAMPGIGRGISEIRIPERGGAYRAFYMIQSELGILLFHAFQKKGRKTPEREKRIARRRLGAFLNELGVKN